MAKRKPATISVQPEVFTREEKPHVERERDEFERLPAKLIGETPVQKKRETIEFPRVGNSASFDYISYVDPPKFTKEEADRILGRESPIDPPVRRVESAPPAQALGYQSYEAPVDDVSSIARAEETRAGGSGGNAGP
jgi:hypothetical protein